MGGLLNKLRGKPPSQFSVYKVFMGRKELICVFHLTNKCNLKCSYCYANTEMKGNILSSNIMTKLLDILVSSSYNPILIEFQGLKIFQGVKIVYGEVFVEADALWIL